jgi:hypothetical protein
MVLRLSAEFKRIAFNDELGNPHHHSISGVVVVVKMDPIDRIIHTYFTSYHVG